MSNASKRRRRPKKTPRERLANRRRKVLSTVLNLLLMRSGEPKPDTQKESMAIVGATINMSGRSLCNVASVTRNLSQDAIDELAKVIGKTEEFVDLSVLGQNNPGVYSRSRKEQK